MITVVLYAYGGFEDGVGGHEIALSATGVNLRSFKAATKMAVDKLMSKISLIEDIGYEWQFYIVINGVGAKRRVSTL